MTAFKATYSDWKLIRTRKVVQVVLEVPVEQADLAYQVLGGMPLSGEEVWVGVARLNSESEVMPDAESRSETPPVPVAASQGRARLVQQAAIACNNPVFQKWIQEHVDPNHVGGSHRTAYVVREYCGVSSRADIMPGTLAAEKWDQLYSRFTAWKLVA